VSEHRRLEVPLIDAAAEEHTEQCADEAVPQEQKHPKSLNAPRPSCEWRGQRADRVSLPPQARIFWEETLVIVSVTSWGDGICRVNDMTQRTEIASVLDFLTEFGVTPA